MKKGIKWYMRNYIVFDGISTEHYATYLSGAGIFEVPKREITKQSIQGRNGDLIFDSEKYGNIPAFFPIIIMDDFLKNKNELASIFSQKVGYKRLENSFEPEYYRFAHFDGMTDISSKTYMDSGKLYLRFDCKPQKFLKTGEQPISVAVNSTVEVKNPTFQTALPLIIVTGTGTFNINNEPYTLSVNTGTVYVDCELREVYEGNINRNNDFTRYELKMPSLKSGINTISCGAGISIKVIPRWFEIS